MSKLSSFVLITCQVFNLFLSINTQSTYLEATLSFGCRTQTESCTTCLNFQSVCSWCSDPEFNNDRCDLSTKLYEAGCLNVYIGNVSKHFIEENKKFSDVTDDVKDAVQIRPQKIKLQLRPGDTQSIKLKYRSAKDYPLELYYLFDFTYTMRDHIETIIELGDKLTHSLSQLTKHSRVGFGAFSDKIVMPFTRMAPKFLKNPCPEYGSCEPPFNFRHYYNLNSNVTSFIEMLNSTKVTANLDNLEGILDALMQVLVCDKKIGWTNESRKLILLLTDGLLHFAGHGKLAGIVERSDGQCHLDEAGFFTESNKQDYPSMNQIYRKLKEHKMSVIFGITSKVYKHFKNLNNLIPNFSFVTEIQSGSKNILNIIKQGYENAVSLIELTDNAKDPIKIEYYSTCRGSFKNKTNSCFNSTENEIYEFELNISFDQCPDDSNLLKQTLIIEESHLNTEQLIVDIELLCGCKCEKTTEIESNCGNHGHMACGICKCDEGWSGKNCDCDLSNFENDRELENMCREITENSTSVMCHGRGDCVCGSCYCQKNYNGKYCQCRDCDKKNGLQCGGPIQGLCDCGECLCMPGFSGPDCLCNDDVRLCKAPGEEIECGGHGQCVCGVCKCNLKPIAFSGRYCEKCSTCDGLCHLYTDCVKCTIEENCENNECLAEHVNQTEFTTSLEDASNGCLVLVNKTACPRWQFVYHMNSDNSVFIKILLPDCYEPIINMGSLSIIVFVSIVVLGILGIVFYKIRIVRSDKIEYAKFRKEIEENTQYQEMNVFYRSPITRVEVPRRNNKED